MGAMSSMLMTCLVESMKAMESGVGVFSIQNPVVVVPANTNSMPEFAPSTAMFMSPVSRAATVEAMLAVMEPQGKETGIDGEAFGAGVAADVSHGGVTWVMPWPLLQAARPRANARGKTCFTVGKLSIAPEGGNGSRCGKRPPAPDARQARSAASRLSRSLLSDRRPPRRARPDRVIAVFLADP